MGTNYYLYDEKPCECCGRGGDPRHIGKSSAGWHFALHVDPEQRIDDLDDWKRLFESGAEIKDEYGATISVSEMIDTITNRSWPKGNRWTHSEFRDNGAEQGLNNLVRSRVDGNHCIGHGDGTWDLITGEFS